MPWEAVPENQSSLRMVLKTTFNLLGRFKTVIDEKFQPWHTAKMNASCHLMLDHRRQPVQSGKHIFDIFATKRWHGVDPRSTDQD